jgi:hypothetical protein
LWVGQKAESSVEQRAADSAGRSVVGSAELLGPNLVGQTVVRMAGTLADLKAALRVEKMAESLAAQLAVY